MATHLFQRVSVRLFVLLALIGAVPSGCMKPEEAKKWKQATAGGEQQPSTTENRATGTAEPAIGSLRYAVQQGDRFDYQVDISAQLDDVSDVLTGVVSYKVVHADKFEFVLEPSNGLRPATIPRDTTAGGYYPPRVSWGVGRFGATGRATIDRKGNIIEHRLDVELPYLLGGIATLAIEPLTADKDAWSAERSLERGNKVMPGLTPHVASRQRPSRIALSQLPTAAEGVFVSSGTLRTDYRRKPASEGEVTIEKRVNLHCEAGDESGPIQIDLKGSGYVTYESKESMPNKSKMSFVVELSFPNHVTKIPLTLSYRRLSQEEVAKRDEQMAEIRAMAEASLSGGGPLDPQQTRALLEEIKDPTRRSFLLGRLQRSRPNEMRPQVAAALEELLNKKNQSDRESVLMALEVWATRDNIPALLALVDDANSSVSRHAMRTLATMPDERSAVAIARQLKDPKKRFDARGALIAIGPLAEERVIEYLSSDDGELRDEACEILGVIGTRKSIPKLEAIVDNDSVGGAYPAERAIKQINSRP